LIKPNLKLFNLIETVYCVISFAESSSNFSNFSGIHFGKKVAGKD
jgi:hypothetical protein